MVHVVHPEKGVQNVTNIIFLVQTKYNTQGRNTYIGIRDFFAGCHFYSYRLYNRFKQYFNDVSIDFETLLRKPSSTEQRVFYTIFAIGQTISSVYPLNLNAGFHVKIYMWSNG